MLPSLYTKQISDSAAFYSKVFLSVSGVSGCGWRRGILHLLPQLLYFSAGVEVKPVETTGVVPEIKVFAAVKFLFN